MNITIRDDKKIDINMKDQLLKAIKRLSILFRIKLSSFVVSSPDKQHINLINEYAADSNEIKPGIFHSVTEN